MTQPVLGSVYSYPGNPRVFKAQIAALYNNTSISLIPDFEFGQTNKSADFLSKFPLGKVPAFEGVDGFSLYESAAIAFYGKFSSCLL